MNVTETSSWWRRSAAAAGALAAGLVVALAAPAGAAEPGNIDEDATGSIIVHKHADQVPPAVSQNPEGTGAAIPSDPIAGVEFTIYRITGIDLTSNVDGWNIVNGWATTPPVIDVSGATPVVGGYATTLEEVLDPTNGAGVATSGALDVAAYVVVETDAPANVTAPAAPFVVTIPTPFNGGWVYDVNVYPKNTVSPLTPTKDVDAPSALGLGSTVTFPVTTPIRNLADTVNFSHYWVQDVLDPRLTSGGVASVQIDGVDVDSDFYSVIPPSTANGNLVSVHFNQDGLEFLKDNGGKSLVTTFTGTVSSVGTGTIGNRAYFSADTVVAPTPPATPDLPPTDPDEPDYPGGPSYPGDPTNQVFTNWGDLVLSKVNAVATADVLEGAVFEVYAATNPYAADQAGAGAATGSPISVNGVTQFESDENGRVDIAGLFVSDSDTTPPTTTRWYVIREVQAPSGYVLPTNPDTAVQVTVGTTAAYDVQVTNTQQSGPSLPLTGANGQLLMTLAGLALVLVAVGGALAARNRSKHAN